MSKCCRKKKSRSFSKRHESRKSPPPKSKRNPPQKNHPPLDAEERATIANFVKNFAQRCLPPEPDLTEPIGASNTPFGHSRLQNIKHILDARAAQCKTSYLAKQNISTLKDASGDDHLVAKQNPFASDTAQDEEPLVAKKTPFAPHTDQNEEPHVAKKTPPPTWDETPLIGKNESRSLRPKVDDGPRPPGRPLWMPEGADLERTPVEIRQAVAEILRPAYEELVVQAGSGMEKSLGASLVHLLWLEILEQYDIKKDYCKFDLLLEVDGTRGFAIDRYLKLVNSKLRLSSMLTRLRQLRLKDPNGREDKENSVGWAPPTEKSVGWVSPTMNRSTMNFDDKNQMPDSSAQDLKPRAQDQKVQNPKSAHEKPATENSEPRPKSQDQKTNMQNPNFDDENQPSNSPAQDQSWKNQELAPKNQSPLPLPPSPFRKPQTWRNNNLAPKNDSTFPLPLPLTHLPSSAFPIR
jgi:hypothetical protein